MPKLSRCNISIICNLLTSLIIVYLFLSSTASIADNYSLSYFIKLLIHLLSVSFCLFIIYLVSVFAIPHMFLWLRYYNYISIFIIIYIVFSLVFISGEDKFNKIVRKHYTYGTTIITEKDTLVSDSTYYYIDKTKAFVFMYNEIDSAIVVLPMDKVVKLKLHFGYPDLETFGNKSQSESIRSKRLKRLKLQQYYDDNFEKIAKPLTEEMLK